ncbi:MAG: hypothetical protein IJW31_03185 [Lentisphaeria bacterium]|nr:hypothetical protein [Lentisphaeria bacterium]
MKLFFRLSIVVFALIILLGCSSNKDNVDEILTLAVQSAKANQWKNVYDLANNALKIDSNNVNALLLKAVAAENLQNREVAIDEASQAVKNNPDNFVALYTIGNLYSQDNLRLSDAIGYLKKAHQLNPNDINTLVLLSNNSIKLKSPKAKEYLSRLSQLDGAYASSVIFCNMLGCANAFDGNLKQAGKEIIRAYNLSSGKDAVVVYNLAVLFDGYFKQSSKAVAFYKKFIDLAGKSSEYSALSAHAKARISNR